MVVTARLTRPLARAYGPFSRNFQLPDYVDEDRLTADLVDGVLTIRIPKHPKAQPRKIAFGTGKDVKRLER